MIKNERKLWLHKDKCNVSTLFRGVNHKIELEQIFRQNISGRELLIIESRSQVLVKNNIFKKT